MTDLIGLALKVEGLSGPDREVDCLIADIVGAWPKGWLKHLPGMKGAPWAYHNPEGSPEWMEALAYTASLDAAMTLARDEDEAETALYEAQYKTPSKTFRADLPRFLTAQLLRARISAQKEGK